MFDDYHEVHYAPGDFAVIGWDGRCLCASHVPGTKPYTSAPDSVTRAKGIDIRQQAPNVWSISSDELHAAFYSGFESPTLFTSGLAPFRAENGWGYMDRDGNAVIAPRFSKAEPFNHDGYAVAADGKSTVILHREVTVRE